MGEDVSRELIGASARIVPPVVRINLVPDSDIAEILRNFERLYLVSSIGFLVN